ncbi:MAG: urea transporter [Bacteroidota bacterium]
MEYKNSTLATTTSPFLKGIGQIMLQDNIWTGLFFLAGIFCGSSTMGLAAILAVVTGTYTAKLLKYPSDEINSGLYGFSATLVGVALIIYFQPTITIWLAIVIGSILATMIQHFFIVKKIPAYTFPFILVTWLCLFITYKLPFLTEPPALTSDLLVNHQLSTLPLAFGQVIFQNSIWSGILFFAGVLINRPIAAIYALVAAALSGFIAYSLGEPTKDIYLGLLSYNAVLCAITFAGKKIEDFVLALIAVVLAVIIMSLMRSMNLPALTFPFVLASWIVILLKKIKR